MSASSSYFPNSIAVSTHRLMGLPLYPKCKENKTS
nr:MAG TPA: hypothetical protein [Caudoviricetes sp.]